MARHLVLGLSLCLVACESGETIEWGIRFASNADRDRAMWITARVARDTCDGEALFSERIARGAGWTMTPEPLGAGEWFFDVVALDAQCTEVARVCDIVELPLGAPELVTVLESYTDPTPGCAMGRCVDGVCVGQTPQPDPPRVVWPYNGVYTGSPHAAIEESAGVDALRPLVRWEAVAGAGSYLVQLAPCEWRDGEACDFTDAVSVRAVATDTEAAPDERLPVSMSPPVGERYAVRVGACAGPDDVECAFSTPRYLEVGRMREDLDGDGFGDAVLTQRDSMAQQPVLFAGGPGAPTDPIVGAAFWTAGAHRQPIAYAGDSTGDDFGELAIRDARAAPARVQLLRRDASGLGAHSDPAGNALGEAIASVGDVDGDGYPDLAIGAPDRGQGQLEIRYGGTGFPGDDDIEGSPSSAGNEHFGFAVAPAGDWDGDGLADVAVLERGAEPRHNMITLHVLARFPSPEVVYTSSEIDAFSEPFAQDVFLAGGRDLDGDGRADVAMGMADTNAVVIFLAPPPDGDVRVLVHQLSMVPRRARVGQTVVLADHDGDGRASVIAGMPGVDEAGRASGGVVILSTDGVDVMESRVLPMAGEPELGREVFALDFDGDGSDEIGALYAAQVAGSSTRGVLLDFSGLRDPVERALDALPAAMGSFSFTAAAR